MPALTSFFSDLSSLSHTRLRKLAEAARTVSSVSSDGVIVIILDGLDALEDSRDTDFGRDRSGLRSLQWLPFALPPQVRLVIGARPNFGGESDRASNLIIG